MDQQNPTLAKIPILDTRKFEQWQFRIQQYLQHEHYALWEVIEFGDSYEAPANAATTGTTSDGTGKKKGKIVTLTADDMQKRKNDVKARTTLLLSLPDEHQLRFSKYKTAQELWATILKTFGGNEATKKTKKNLLKQQYGNFKAEGSETLEQTFNRLQLMHTIVWRNRSDLDTMSLDDLYNHLKVYESEVQKKSKPNSQNMAFISSAKHNRGNEEVNTASTNVSTASANIGVASISQDTACAYIAFQSSGSQIKFEDINQIDEDDMEEMDIKWNIALLSMRADSGSQIKFEDINQIDEDDMEEMDIKWNIALLSMRADRAPKSQDRGRRDNYRQGFKVKEHAPKALMAIDGVGWDWSYMANDEENHALVADEEAPTGFALMAKTGAESEVFDSSLCSKACKKNTDSLNSKITELTDKLFDAKNMIYHYKLALAQVEARLAKHRNQELKYCKKIRVLEFNTESSTDCIENLKKELELIKKEKEGLDSKLAGFQTASKDLDSLLESQRLDKNKEGLGYSDVPPPPAQVYSPPKKDLSWTGLPEFKDDIVTDYSRPSPAIESTLDDAQNRNPSEASPSTILPKSFIKFVKTNDSPTKSKTDKVETAKKPPVKYAEQYIKPTKKPNVRGNQRNWNNLKSHQLGYKTWIHHEPDLPLPPPLIDYIRQPQMSDKTVLLNDLSYIPPNNEHNEISNEPTQAIRNEFEELYASANEELYPGCYYVTRLDFMGDDNKDLDLCPVCNTSRWKDSNTLGKKVPKKCTDPGKMQHHVDGRAWKNFDTKYPDFAKEPRNVRLGLAADGFNLFGNLSQAYSMWSGVETIDVASGQKFNIRAMVLWTINDFPARSSFFGWSGQGYKACPTCNEDTPSVRMLSKTAYVGHRRFLKKPHKWRSSREFNGQTDNRDPPKEFGRDEILAQHDRLPMRMTGKHPSYGGVKIKRHRQGKTRLVKVGHSKWLVARPNQKREVLEASGCVLFHTREPKKFCHFIKGVKLPDGFGSCFKHKVTYNDTNITGLKSHNCHIMMQRLLPYGLQNYLPDKIAKPIIVLCSLFKQICSATLMEDDMLKAQIKVVDIMCDLELIYPPALFDIMIYLVIHLHLEALKGGPIRPWWMFSFKRYMKKLKDVVWSHDGDGGGEDRPPPHHVPTGCGGCFANRDKGKRKPNLGGRAAGKLHTRDKTWNLSLKEITDKKGPVTIRFEVRDKQTLMPFGDYAAHWSSYIGEVIRGVPLYYPSWLKVPKERKAALITDIGTQFDLRPHMESPDWTEIDTGIQQHLQKAYNTNKAIFKAHHWVIDTQTGTYNVEKIRQASTQEYPSLIDTFFVAHTVNGVFTRDEYHLTYVRDEGVEATGTYNDDEINRLARRGKHRRHIPDVGRVLPARVTSSPSRPAPKSTLKSLHEKVDFMMSLFKSDSKFSDAFSQFESASASGSGESGGCGDDVESVDDQEDEDEDSNGDNSPLIYKSWFSLIFLFPDAFFVGNKMHKAFLLPAIKLLLPEQLSTASEVIEFRDSYEAPANDPSTTTINTTSGEAGTKSRRTVTLTTEDMQKKKNDVKARTTLLLSLPDEHQLRFSKYKTAQELWAVILKTFGGNEATKKTKKNLLKQQYGNFRAEGSKTLEQTFTRLQVIIGQLQFMDVELEQDDLNQKFLTSLAPECLMHTIVWRNMIDLDTMSLDDLYNHLKVYETEVQKKTEPNTQNSNVPTASANVATVSISQETTYAYIASQSSGSQIKFEDINQIDEDDMKKMDIKWNMALLSMRADKFWKKIGKKISIQRSDLNAELPETRTDEGETTTDRGKAKEQALKALMAIDGVGWDWSYMANDGEDHALVADEKAPTEFALMANTSSESKVFDNSLCSKDSLAQVESRLVEYKEREVKYVEKIRTLEYYHESKKECIKSLRKELETLKQEKEVVDGKLAGILTASKDLDNIIESQRSHKSKESLGYTAVPPPPAQLYLSPKKDLSWTGLPKCADDTVTDYSRPSPTVESSLKEDQNRNPFVSENVASPITPK
nr:hypothetical protein [Tanacetum cinerariifolium]